MSNVKSRTLAATSAIALISATAAMAQTEAPQSKQGAAPQAQSQSQAAAVAEVVVTGSRIKRSKAEGPSPVTVFSVDQMKKDGFANVYDALKTVTEATGAVHNDYDWGPTAVNGYALNLRNLGPGRTLLLINGHRVTDYPMPYDGKGNFANFNNLPSGIIDRVEILSNGASAIYGSDAMGGVVNVILKKDADEQTLRVKYGGATRGGRQNWETVLSGGKTGDDWSIVYNLQHFDRETLIAGDRSFYKQGGEDARPRASWNPQEHHFNFGAINPTFGIALYDMDQQSADGNNLAINPPAGACNKYGSVFYPIEQRGFDRNTGTEYHDGNYCAYRIFQNWAVRRGSVDDSGYLYGAKDFGEVKAWASIGLWHTVGGFNSQLDGLNSEAILSPTVFWDPRANNNAGGSRLANKILSVGEQGGVDNTMVHTYETAWDFNAGIKGKIFNNFDWELSAGGGTYDLRESFPTFDQGKMIAYYFGPQLGAYTYPVGSTSANYAPGSVLPIYEPDYSKLWNPTPSSDVAKFEHRGDKLARSWQYQTQAVISGKLFDGWAGPVQVAAVLEAARQGYDLTPEPKVLNAGLNGDTDLWYHPFGNTEQGGGARSRFAAGAEVSIPLLTWVNLTAAGRWDRYDAVASSSKFTYQTGLEVRPTQNLLLRGTYGTSFRAPDMHFVYARSSAFVESVVDYSKCFAAGFPNHDCGGTSPGEPFRIANVTIERKGSPDLLYETGTSFTAGAVWDATRRLSLSVDYWNIDIRNLIDDIGYDQVLKDESWCRYHMTPDGSTLTPPLSAATCALETGRVQRDSQGNLIGVEQGPVNRAERRVDGIDAKASYRFPRTRFGTFGLSANYTVLLGYMTRDFPTDPLTSDLVHQDPRYKFNATVNWYQGKWDAALYMYGKAGGRDNRWGQCASFPDGFRGMDANTCKDTDPNSPTFGQSTKKLYEYRTPRIYFNASVGYDITKRVKFNLYVSNIFDTIYGDKYCGDFAYCIDDPVGREVSGELVAKF